MSIIDIIKSELIYHYKPSWDFTKSRTYHIECSETVYQAVQDIMDKMVAVVPILTTKDEAEHGYKAIYIKLILPGFGELMFLLNSSKVGYSISERL